MPELHAVSGPPDVVIRLGGVALHLDDAVHSEEYLDVAGSAALLRLDDIRYLVEDGERIRIDAPSHVDPIDVRIWLLGTVMAALLHQRGILPLHANSIAVGAEGAAIFAGPSGAGKSTLAAWFAERGRPVLGDDLCAVHFDGAGAPFVHAGVARLKLWEDTLAAFGRPTANLSRVATEMDKYHVPLPAADSGDDLRAWPLRRVYLLDEAQSAGDLITPLRGIDAAHGILDNAFRWTLGQRLKRGHSPFEQCLAVARHAAVFRLNRHRGFDRFFNEAEAVERHVDQLLMDGGAAKTAVS